MAAGADHDPPSLRHSMNPLPYLPPMMKAPFFNPGTITTHAAFWKRSDGIPLSGAAMISSNTTAEVSNRFTASFAAFNDAQANPAPSRATIAFIRILRVQSVEQLSRP